MSTGEFIIVTTGWAMVGAFGQMWVEMSTSPGRRARFCAMRPSLRGQAAAGPAPAPRGALRRQATELGGAGAARPRAAAVGHEPDLLGAGADAAEPADDA